MKIKALGYIVIEAKNPTEWHSFLTTIVGFMPATLMPQSGNNLFFKMSALNSVIVTLSLLVTIAYSLLHETHEEWVWVSYC